MKRNIEKEDDYDQEVQMDSASDSGEEVVKEKNVKESVIFITSNDKDDVDVPAEIREIEEMSDLEFRRKFTDFGETELHAGEPNDVPTEIPEEMSEYDREMALLNEELRDVDMKSFLGSIVQPTSDQLVGLLQHDAKIFKDNHDILGDWLLDILLKELKSKTMDQFWDGVTASGSNDVAASWTLPDFHTRWEKGINDLYATFKKQSRELPDDFKKEYYDCFTQLVKQTWPEQFFDICENYMRVSIRGHNNIDEIEKIRCPFDQPPEKQPVKGWPWDRMAILGLAVPIKWCPEGDDEELEPFHIDEVVRKIKIQK